MATSSQGPVPAAPVAADPLVASPAVARLGRGRAALAAGLAGFGCMAAELTAVRLLAPHFGDSAYVWTNVIGVILAALAGGAWWGGRLAGRGDARRWAVRLLIAAGAYIALAPWLSTGLGGLLLPADLPLDAAMPAMVRGSFVATALLFAPAMVCLGAVSPLLVTAVVRGGCDIGAAAGTMAAAGTIGSLGGTFAATHLLVPSCGCRIAMGVAGAVLVAGALLVALPRARRVAGLVLLLGAGAMLVPRGPLRPVAPGVELLAERESRIQFLQVVRDASAAPARTSLRINEGLDSFHSLAIEGSAFAGGSYYDWHALAPLLAGDGVRPDGLRALSIGDAAGTLRTVYAGVHPGARVDAVDVDLQAMLLGDEFFPGPRDVGSDYVPKAAGRRYVFDGRVFLAQSRERWHVIHVDAYAHQVYVPAHLASREFFAAALERLEPGGVIACNVGALHDRDAVLRAIGASMHAVFGHALALQVPQSRNALLVARNGAPPDPRRLGDFAFGGERLRAADQEHWRGLVAAGAAARWSDVSVGGEVLVDDRPVLDRLLAASYVDRHDTAQLVACAGRLEPVAAETAAYAAWQRRDAPAVLEAVATSRAESAFLRQLAGNARWSLRELRSARAELGRAAELGDDPALRARVAADLAELDAQIAPVAAAERAAARNGWGQLGLVVAALAAIGIARRCA